MHASEIQVKHGLAYSKKWNYIFWMDRCKKMMLKLENNCEYCKKKQN
jgi:hypothetical protein